MIDFFLTALIFKKCDAARPVCTQCGGGQSEGCEYVVGQERLTVQVFGDITSRSAAPFQGLQDPIVAQESQFAPLRPLPNASSNPFHYL